MCPLSAAAPVYSARNSAAASATRATKKLRQLGRSRPCQRLSLRGPSRALVRRSRDSKFMDVRLSSEGNASGFHDFAQNRFDLRGFLLRARITRVHHHAMCEHRQYQLLEIVRRAEFTAFEISPRLRRALQHQKAARAYAERELLRAARALDDVNCVVAQAVVNTYEFHRSLHHL